VRREHVERVFAMISELQPDNNLSALLFDQVCDELVTISDSVTRPTPGLFRQFRQMDPSTSRKAAFDSMPRNGTRRREILKVISDSRGLTYEEAGLATGAPEAWKRISELRQGGWIEPAMINGETKTRKTRTGSLATVWVATTKAGRNGI